MTIAQNTACDVVEFRRYVMLPGRRDELIDLFEHEFIESQELCGMLPIGHYRDLLDPDNYAWFRGFADMESRRCGLEEFYQRSPSWLQNRNAANATMIDSDNVLLLRPANPGSGFRLEGLHRPNLNDAQAPPSFVGVAVFMLREPASPEAVAEFQRDVVPRLQKHAQRVAVLVTEERPNNYPRLPVREQEWALVTTAVCPTVTALNDWIYALEGRRLPEAVRSDVIRSEYYRLTPATRSLYR